MLSNTGTRAALAVLVLHLGGCSQDRTDANNDEDASEDTGPLDSEYWDYFVIHRAVDILFVIDNSSSMLAAQNNLAAGIENLVSVLETSPFGTDYRIGITTTDNGNPWCAGGAEEGRLVATSCQGRLTDFVVEGSAVDDSSGACTSTCAHPALEIVPTRTSGDPSLAPRPWFENHFGQTNIGGGVSFVEALGCALPQGASGCTFEAPLESMWKALIRSTISDDPSHKFLRDGASLAVVFLTDGTECSYDPVHEEVFSPQGSRVFWSDPEAETPTAAVCWNAGVRCEGYDAGEYTTCAPQDHDTGEDTYYSEHPVLYPIERYLDLLKELEQNKKQAHPDAEVLVTLIAGVPTDYPATPIRYPRTSEGSANPNFVSDFGIGPGCVSGVTDAVPPVRLAELAREFGLNTNNVFSVCGADYGPVLRNVGEEIVETMRPLCVLACVADAEPKTPTLEPSCEVERVVRLDDGDTTAIPVPPCDPGRTLPSGHTTCYVPVTRPEEMEPGCVELGLNLELELVEAPDATTSDMITVSCEVSQTRELDCPGLPR